MELPPLLLKAANHSRHLYWRIARPHTFGVKVLLLHEDRALLIRHSYDKDQPWTVPGGGYRPKRETAESAAGREVFEELGIQLGRLVLLGDYMSTREHKRDTITCFSAETKAVEVQLSSEIAAAEWFDLTTLPDNTSFATKQIIAMNESHQIN